MEAGIAAAATKFAFAVPHCRVCPLFLGQSVPVVATAHGYGLFCEVCDLGRGAVTVRVRDAEMLRMTVDEPVNPADAGEEE